MNIGRKKMQTFEMGLREMVDHLFDFWQECGEDKITVYVHHRNMLIEVKTGLGAFVEELWFPRQAPGEPELSKDAVEIKVSLRSCPLPASGAKSGVRVNCGELERFLEMTSLISVGPWYCDSNAGESTRMDKHQQQILDFEWIAWARDLAPMMAKELLAIDERVERRNRIE